MSGRRFGGWQESGIVVKRDGFSVEFSEVVRGVTSALAQNIRTVSQHAVASLKTQLRTKTATRKGKIRKQEVNFIVRRLDSMATDFDQAVSEALSDTDSMWHRRMAIDNHETHLYLQGVCYFAYCQLVFAFEDFCARCKRVIRNVLPAIDRPTAETLVDRIEGEHNFPYAIRNCIVHHGGEVRDERKNEIILTQARIGNLTETQMERQLEEWGMLKVRGQEPRIFVINNQIRLFPQDIHELYSLLANSVIRLAEELDHSLN
jgi:hypothetical protein